MSEQEEYNGIEDEVVEEQPEEQPEEETGDEVESAADSEESAEEQPEEQDVPPKHVPRKALEDERRKRQELEAELAKYRQTQPQPVPQLQQQAAQTIYDYFEVDPESTLAWLDNELAAREDAYNRTFDPDEEAAIRKLERTKVDLVTKHFLSQRKAEQERQRLTPIEQEIRIVIPDDQKKAQIKAFAVQNGLDEDLAEAMLDPRQAGPNAVKFAKLLSNLQSQSATPTKRVSKAPDPIAPVGGNRERVARAEDQMSDDEWLKHAREEARKKGRLW